MTRNPFWNTDRSVSKLSIKIKVHLIKISVSVHLRQNIRGEEERERGKDGEKDVKWRKRWRERSDHREEDTQKKPYQYSAKAYVSLAKSLLSHFSFFLAPLISTNNLLDFLGTKLIYFMTAFSNVLTSRKKNKSTVSYPWHLYMTLAKIYK